jgi:hypothetical protein
LKGLWFVVACGVAGLLAASAGAQEISITLGATPPFAALRAFSEPTQITVSFRSSDGALIDAGTASVSLEAPPRGRIFSTDFPFVEGSRLLDFHLPIRGGKIQWEYLFPIRGEYRMTVDAAAGEKRGTSSFLINIREKEQKWLFLALFTAGLFIAGFIAGRIFTGSGNRRINRASAAIIAVIWSLTATGAFTALENSGASGEMEIKAAPVGELSRLRWVRPGSIARSLPVNLSLRITHLEKQKTIFSMTKVPVEKEFAFGLQFTDGDEYRVEALSELENGAAIRSERTLSIVAREPPISASLPSLIFFVSVIAVGLWVGRRSCYRRFGPE